MATSSQFDHQGRQLQDKQVSAFGRIVIVVSLVASDAILSFPSQSQPFSWPDFAYRLPQVAAVFAGAAYLFGIGGSTDLRRDQSDRDDRRTGLLGPGLITVIAIAFVGLLMTVLTLLSPR
jgi:hypothetical protein